MTKNSQFLILKTLREKMIYDLPHEILLYMVINFLDQKSIGRLAQVNKWFMNLLYGGLFVTTGNEKISYREIIPTLNKIAEKIELKKHLQFEISRTEKNLDRTLSPGQRLDAYALNAIIWTNLLIAVGVGGISYAISNNIGMSFFIALLFNTVGIGVGFSVSYYRANVKKKKLNHLNEENKKLPEQELQIRVMP